MSGTRLVGRAVLACVVVAITCCALAGDWPQWRGPNRDGKVADFTAPKEWPKTLTQKWKIEVGAGDTSPVLVGDKVYVFARQEKDEVLLCLNAADGKEVWKQKYEVPAISGPSARAHSGPRATPAVADGKVVTLGVTGVASCFDAAKGDVLWRKEPGKEAPAGVPQFYTAASPLILDGMAVLLLGAPDKGGIYAFDLAKGDEKWKWTDEGPAYSSPSVMTVDGVKLIVAMMAKDMVAVNAADGKFAWKTPFAPTGMTYNAPSPIIDGQTLIYTGPGRGTTAVKIEKKDDGFAAKELWKNPDIATAFNTPVPKDGLLFGLSTGADRRGGGKFFCLSAKDGKTAWIDSKDRGTTYGATVAADSVIIALTSKADLVVFDASDKSYIEKASYKVSEKPVYGYPAISDKRIFVKDETSLILWMIE
ncbi:MAG: PQQ-binding-like beta-propeller repeat protein [Phycisphaerae bacterium]